MRDAISSLEYRDIEGSCRPIKPGERHETGHWYFCGYWRYAYKVLAVDGCRVKCVTPVDGRIWWHSTALNARQDYVIDHAWGEDYALTFGECGRTA